ncbi:MAG: PAS domain S-box protein, partial [Pseudomonadota bacterium]
MARDQPHLEWLDQLRTVLAGEDADQALAAALALLGRAGMRQAPPGDDAWLSVEQEGRVVRLTAGAAMDDTTRVLLACVLQVAVARIADQARLARVSERANMLSAASFEGIMIHENGVIIDANERLAEMLGYTHQEVIGENTLRLCVAPEDMPEVLHRMANRTEGGYVITGIRKDGSRFRAELNSKQGRLGARPVRVAAVRDVTERERMTRLLKESETRFRDLVQQTFDVMVLSRDGMIVEVGGALERLLGRKRDDVIGRPLMEFVAPSARQVTREVIAEQRTGSYRSVVVGASGASVPVEVVAVTSSMDGEPVRVAGLRDLSAAQRQEAERRRLEERVEQSQRLESLGVLAGGIAHDFNNLLVGILGNADLLRVRLTEPLDRELAEDISNAGKRAADLTRQMLAYAGKRDFGPPELLDIGHLCRELRALLGASLSKKARLEISIEPGTVIRGDRATITQLFMNLLTNASDALEGGVGTITVRGRRVSVRDPRWDHALGAPVRPGKLVLVEVEDDGV